MCLDKRGRKVQLVWCAEAYDELISWVVAAKCYSVGWQRPSALLSTRINIEKLKAAEPASLP